VILKELANNPVALLPSQTQRRHRARWESRLRWSRTTWLLFPGDLASSVMAHCRLGMTSFRRRHGLGTGRLSREAIDPLLKTRDSAYTP
jgi:hypothetical protein